MEKHTIHMVVTDLDDTLLSRTKEISEEAVRLIEELKKRNVRFTFITGRPPYAVKRFAEKVNITAPIVACNGAMIVNAETEEIIEKSPLPLKPLEEILKQAKERGHTILILVGNIEYTLSETSWTRKRKEDGRELPIAELEKLLLREDIYKVNIMEEAGQSPFSDFIPWIEEKRNKYSVALYGTSGCEIVAKNINKETGLRKLCRLCGTEPEYVLAVGDNENDLEMIRAAGIGAAVANASAAVKQAADYVCGRGYTDGVTEAISKFVMGEEGGER